jgi:hypothetical protein
MESSWSARIMRSLTQGRIHDERHGYVVIFIHALGGMTGHMKITCASVMRLSMSTEVIFNEKEDNDDVRNDCDLSPCISSPVFARIDYHVGPFYYGCLGLQ